MTISEFAMALTTPEIIVLSFSGTVWVGAIVVLVHGIWFQWRQK